MEVCERFIILPLNKGHQVHMRELACVLVLLVKTNVGTFAFLAGNRHYYYYWLKNNQILSAVI